MQPRAYGEQQPPLRDVLFDRCVAVLRAEVDASTLVALAASVEALARAVARGDGALADVEALRIAGVGCRLAGVAPDASTPPRF